MIAGSLSINICKLCLNYDCIISLGQYQKDLSRVIEAMFGRFEKFAKLDHCHLKKVRVVVYDEKEMEKVSKILKEPTGDLEKYIKSNFKIVKLWN